MAEKIKIELEDLDKDSAPCEICVAMNSREVETNEDKYYFDSKYCIERGGMGRSGCIDLYRAQMKTEFLNYIEHKKPKER